MSSGKTGKNIFFLTADLPICFEAFKHYKDLLESQKSRIKSAMANIEMQLRAVNPSLTRNLSDQQVSQLSAQNSHKYRELQRSLEETEAKLSIATFQTNRFYNLMMKARRNF